LLSKQCWFAGPEIGCRERAGSFNFLIPSCREVAVTAFVIRSTIDRHPQRASGFVARILDVVATWHDRAVQRRMLAGLSEYQLHDIGLSRSQVFCEIEKPFWRV